MSELREYCKKHGIKLKVLPDSIEVRYAKKHGTAHFNDFTNGLIRPLRKIKRLTGYEYVPSPYSFNYRDFPTVKVKATFRLNYGQ